MSPDLSVCLVTYHPDEAMLTDTLVSLLRAVELVQQAGELGRASLFLVDNGSDPFLLNLARKAGWQAVELISGHGNVGFGRGHNFALERASGDFHLILNPDVDLQPDALLNAVRFMQSNPDCGVLSPAIQGKTGAWTFLCKTYPSLLDLFLRGFMPNVIKRLFSARLARYDMAWAAKEAVLWDPPIVSGCFMFCRRSLLQALNGFDPRFFLYFEDFDLSLRASRMSRLAAVSSVRIVHYGGDAGRKGWAHVRMFCVSAGRFFSKHGWKLV